MTSNHTTNSNSTSSGVVVGSLLSGSTAIIGSSSSNNNNKPSRTNSRIGPNNSGTRLPLYQNNNNNSQQQQQQNQFYPKYITAQIISLQCFHYTLLTVLFQLNHVLFGTSITIDRIFTDKYLHTSIFQSGWSDSLAIVLASLAGSFLLTIIIEKSKKCLDFACTLFLLHLLLCTLYDGFPKRYDWWIIHIFGTILMILLGEYLCSKREMEDIPLLQL